VAANPVLFLFVSQEKVSDISPVGDTTKALPEESTAGESGVKDLEESNLT
jgi:hypothetical protein